MFCIAFLYLVIFRVLERWKEEFENDEEKKIFVGNVMETTLDNERLLAGNQGTNLNFMPIFLVPFP